MSGRPRLSGIPTPGKGSAIPTPGRSRASSRAASNVIPAITPDADYAYHALADAIKANDPNRHRTQTSILGFRISETHNKKKGQVLQIILIV